VSEIDKLRAENEELRYQVSALKEAMDTNNLEAQNWKARLLDKIRRLEGALEEAKP
jgi:predicted RNase H-like nuclease (RuvC/YqgF family)